MDAMTTEEIREGFLMVHQSLELLNTRLDIQREIIIHLLDTITLMELGVKNT